jgi:hypothetical protein
MARYGPNYCELQKCNHIDLKTYLFPLAHLRNGRRDQEPSFRYHSFYFI